MSVLPFLLRQIGYVGHSVQYLTDAGHVAAHIEAGVGVGRE